MNSKKTGMLSGCVVWGFSIGIILSCVLPVCIIAGSFTSFSQLAIQTTGNIICPDETSPERYSYQSTTTDEFGNTQPSTAYELHCVDQNGEVVKEDPIAYSFLWIGGFAFVGLILSGILAFALAAPAGALIGHLLNRNQKPKFAANIEPE
jgi:hypothetical protein